VHPRLQEIIHHLDTHRAALKTAVDDTPPSLRTKRPGPDRWSVAEILEHLAIVEASIGNTIAGKLAAARAAGLGQDIETTPVVPTVDMARLLDRNTRLVAGTAAEPTGTRDDKTSWTTLVTLRDGLKATLREADGLALGDLTWSHPRLGTMNGYQWLLFLGAHEGRHAAQIEEVMRHITAD
jgi:uncharacterized damage-inducible protein DinB